MIKVGVTGGIGAGKSLLCKIFEVYGYPTFYADAQAKYLINNDKKLKSGIVKLLGSKAYDDKGNYDRVFVGAKVFNNKKLLTKLNALVHPTLHDHADQWFAKSKSKIAFYEAALIIEADRVDKFDELICVTAPMEIRIERVMKRNGISRTQVIDRINSQTTDQEKRKHASYEIINDGKHSLIHQAMNFHHYILS